VNAAAKTESHPIDTLHRRIHREWDFFPGQRANEHVKLCIRQHWVVYFVVAFRAIFWTALLFLGFLLTGDILSSVATKSTLFFFASLYLLVVWLWSYIAFIKNELTVLLITSERILDIDQSSLFVRQVSETSLDKIQDVVGKINGFFASVFDFGDVEIQTAGYENFFEGRKIASPHLTARKILDVQQHSGMHRRDADRLGSGKVKRRAGEEDISEAEILKMRARSRRSSDQRKPPEAKK